jgi:hypothetical protein
MDRGRLRRLLMTGVGVLAVATLAMVVPAAQAKHHHKHCRSGQVLKHVGLQQRRHGHRVEVHVWRCVNKKKSSALRPQGNEPAPSIFGIDTGTYDSNTADYGKDIPAARALGARWAHFVLGPETGTGDYKSSDYWVSQAVKERMGVILTFGGIQSACSTSTSNVHGCPPTTGADLTAYQSYVTHVLSHYHSLVDYYESWTEPNHPSQWGGTVDPAQYAALLKAQYQAFQTFNRQHPHSGPGGSDMKLLFGSPNDFGIAPGGSSTAVLPFTQQVLNDLGGQRPFDGAALHAYRYPPGVYGPDDAKCDYIGSAAVSAGSSTPSCPTASGWRMLTWSDELTAYEQLFEDYGYGQTPLWLTEFGWPGGTNPNCYNQAGYCPGEAAQDADLKAAYADLLKLPFVQGALWFNVRDYAPGVSSPDPGYFYHYGLLNYDYSHKPAADDFKSLAAANPSR